MILDTLATLSCAEQFFEVLAVPFDPKVVDVSRLHILKRFRELVRRHDGVTEETCRAVLAEAYAEFAQGRGAKTFKVFTDAMPGFVPLSALRRP